MCKLLLACLLLALPGACRTTDAAAPLRVMGFNLRVPVASDGADGWEHRRDLVARTIRAAAPDVLGTQELVRVQADDLAARLPEYAWFGRGRAGGADDERTGVFYRRDALRLLDSGDFWLSETPAAAGSISWGHPYPRMVTWGLFERIADGRRFRLFNTHLPHRAQDVGARVRGAALILQRIAALPTDEAVVLVGDFNDVPGGEVHRLLLQALDDAWLSAPLREGPAGTFHGFGGRAERRIDWVLVRGLRARRAWTVAEAVNGRYPSDHFPLVVELAWPR